MIKSAGKEDLGKATKAHSALWNKYVVTVSRI